LDRSASASYQPAGGGLHSKIKGIGRFPSSPSNSSPSPVTSSRTANHTSPRKPGWKFNPTTWSSKSAPRNSNRDKRKKKEGSYDYTSWRTPSQFKQRLDAFTSPYSHQGPRSDVPSASFVSEQSEPFFDLAGQDSLSRFTSHPNLDSIPLDGGTRRIPARFVRVAKPTKMTTVRVLPLPRDADLSHHGPSRSTSSYLGYVTKPLTYVPVIGSYLTSYPGGKEKIMPYTYDPDATSPPSGASQFPKTPKYFVNPWPSWKTLTYNDAYTSFQRGATVRLPPAADEDEDPEVHGRLVKVLKPDFSHRTGKGGRTTSGPGGARVCWLGHASVLVQLPWSGQAERGDGTDNGEQEGMCGILFDPIFSKRWVVGQLSMTRTRSHPGQNCRCSPSQWVGPARYMDPPCHLDELPPVHIVCVSHDHCEWIRFRQRKAQIMPLQSYASTDDHLDYDTIMALHKRNRGRIHFFVPLGESDEHSRAVTCRLTRRTFDRRPRVVPQLQYPRSRSYGA
jgi:hypothetical protein